MLQHLFTPMATPEPLPQRMGGALPLRVALGQIDTTVGDFAGNARLIREGTAAAKAAGAEVVVFPELCLTGYPPRDLLEVGDFLPRQDAVFRDLTAPAEWSHGIAVIFGFVASHDGPGAGRTNAAAVLQDGQVELAHKILLPNYDVFDERRYFDPGDRPRVVTVKGRRLGLTICEDCWNDKAFWARPRYGRDPVEELAREGVDLLVNLSASPYARGKPLLREQMLGALARRHGVPLVCTNLWGGNDSLLFDGHSLVLDSDGAVLARARGFGDALLLSQAPSLAPLAEPNSPEEDEELLDALAVGVRDYFAKTGFRGALVGLSGGVDSALTACIAVRALGAGRVRGVALPSRYTADISTEDARTLAVNLGVRFDVVSIDGLRRMTLEALQPAVAPAAPKSITEENLQSRLRGTLLMALANQDGELLLNTGNKSELAVGYCTLYGDMNGALSVLGDLSKAQVYRLARAVNGAGPVIPERVLTRAPTAELREGQTDQDTLPPYDALDEILRLFIEERLSEAQIIERGFVPAMVRDVMGKLVRAEYKRRQAAPILRVSERAFGEGWRFPLAQGFWK
jgi:NAD+ synthase (glutamine-hydrolysing)